MKRKITDTDDDTFDLMLEETVEVPADDLLFDFQEIIETGSDLPPGAVINEWGGVTFDASKLGDDFSGL